MSADADTIRNAIGTLMPQAASAVEFLEARLQSGHWMQQTERLVNGAIAGLTRAATEAREATVVTDAYIDPEDNFVDKLHAHCTALWDLAARLQRSGSATDWGEYVDSLSGSCKALRAAIISHDLKAEPGPAGRFDSLDALVYKRFLKDCDKLDKLYRDRTHGELFRLIDTSPLPLDRLEVLERYPQTIHGIAVMQDLKVSFSLVTGVLVFRRLDSFDGIRRAP